MKKEQNRGPSSLPRPEHVGGGDSEEGGYPPRGIWFSMVLRSVIDPKDALKIVSVASIAIAKPVRKMLGLNATPKWPNDVVVHTKKVCGLLAETRITGGKIDFVVLGIGINADSDMNVFPGELDGSLTILIKAAKHEIPRQKFLQAVLMEHYYDDFIRAGFDRILEEWKGLNDMIGNDVEVVSLGERFGVRAIHVDRDGALWRGWRMDPLEECYLPMCPSDDRSVRKHRSAYGEP